MVESREPEPRVGEPDSTSGYLPVGPEGSVSPATVVLETLRRTGDWVRTSDARIRLADADMALTDAEWATLRASLAFHPHVLCRSNLGWKWTEVPTDHFAPLRVLRPKQALREYLKSKLPPAAQDILRGVIGSGVGELSSFESAAAVAIGVSEALPGTLTRDQVPIALDERILAKAWTVLAPKASAGRAGISADDRRQLHIRLVAVPRKSATADRAAKHLDLDYAEDVSYVAAGLWESLLADSGSVTDLSAVTDDDLTAGALRVARFTADVLRKDRSATGGDPPSFRDDMTASASRLMALHAEGQPRVEAIIGWIEVVLGPIRTSGAPEGQHTAETAPTPMSVYSAESESELRRRLDKADAEIALKTGQLARLNERLAAATAENSRLQDRLRSLGRQLGEVEDTLAAVREELSDMESDKTRLKTRSDEWSGKYAELEIRMRQRDQELQESRRAARGASTAQLRQARIDVLRALGGVLLDLEAQAAQRGPGSEVSDVYRRVEAASATSGIRLLAVRGETVAFTSDSCRPSSGSPAAGDPVLVERPGIVWRTSDDYAVLEPALVAPKSTSGTS